MIAQADSSRNTFLSLINTNKNPTAETYLYDHLLKPPPFSLSLKLVFFWFVGQKREHLSVSAALSSKDAKGTSA